jgi:uncharacterized OB-fold protein
MINNSEYKYEYKCRYCGTMQYSRIENCKNCGANKYVETKIKPGVLSTSNVIDYAEYLNQNIRCILEYLPKI